MLLITSECRIPAGLTRISPSTSSYLLPSLGVFRRSWRVAGTLVVIIVIVMPPPFHRLGTLHVHFPGEAYNGDAPDRRFMLKRHLIVANVLKMTLIRSWWCANSSRPPSSTWTATWLSSCHGRLACRAGRLC